MKRPGRDNGPIMAQPSEPSDVKLICGIICADKELFDRSAETMSESFGLTDLTSPVMDFDSTAYYNEQMGSPLYRGFLSFADLIQPDALASIKLRTNEIEAQFADRYTTAARPINLDPGYIEPSKLVLASMKNFSHRIYLGRGVYAEVTLMYCNGKWVSFDWTFPDYASGRYDSFLTSARNLLRT